MCTKTRLFLRTALILALFVCSRTELIDNDDIERFCFPEAHKNTRKSCECSNESAPPWGMRAVRIDCSFKYLHTDDFGNGVLPLYVDSLDISWNSLDKLPNFTSDSLRLLNLMHNNISSIGSKNFIQIFNLHELYLNWNSLQSIELKAFDGLAHLQVLDLSHNNLRTLNLHTFAPLMILESLSLSWNRQLNEAEGIEVLNFYDTFGVNHNLRTLKLEACGLSTIVLDEKSPLVELDLRRNRLVKVPEKLPITLEKLDLSENLFKALIPADTSLIAGVHELLLEDMPHLREIAEDSLAPLQSLEKISFQNTRALTTLHGYAFGANTTKVATLKSMIFRGTSIGNLNSTLSSIFRQLTVLDLNGMPLHCDCELIWVRELPLETNGRCFKPSRLRGTRLTKASTKDFSCNAWPRWVYSIIILCLIILCSGGIYLIVMGLRPNRGVTMRRKVGAGSPYARVTIEPNRQENLS